MTEDAGKRDYKKKLQFHLTGQEQDVVEIFNYNTKAFTDTLDLVWSLDSLKAEIKDGWSLYSALHEGEIVAALFLKIQNGQLHTKNTPIKMHFRGNGFSHQIKEFYDGEASKQQLASIINYCRKDNFRGISLNESHGYCPTGKFVGPNSEYAIWSKKLKNDHS